jgi:hypothetical protein
MRAVRKLEEPEIAAPLPQAGLLGHEHADAAAVDVNDVAEVDDELALPRANQRIDAGGKFDIAVADLEAACEIEERDIADLTFRNPELCRHCADCTAKLRPIAA